MPDHQSIRDSIIKEVADRFAPAIAALVEAEVAKVVPSPELRVDIPAPTKGKPGRPREPKAYVDGRKIKLSRDPMVRKYELAILRKVHNSKIE